MIDWEAIWPAVDMGGCVSNRPMVGFVVYGRNPKPSAVKRAWHSMRLYVLLSRRKPKRSRIKKKLQKATKTTWSSL